MLSPVRQSARNPRPGTVVPRCPAETSSPDPPARAATFKLRQAWRPSPEAAFRPGAAWVAASADALHIWAALLDEHPRTQATHDHTPLWELGDVFEIFLQLGDGPVYHEFHIAPNGCTLQLRFPDAHWPRAAGIDPWVQRSPGFEATVDTRPGRGIWNVRARIPLSLLTGETTGALAWPHHGRIAFGRYDYDDHGQPCCSHSARLTQCDFHRLHEWTPVTFPTFDAGMPAPAKPQGTA
ncbi:hypothetical protein [Synoicihabitans lomoniglobus]|uniref:Carbohydrate-binding domain-containing protein n=1 Tax=Synoicihabitans lomoniglobus TaxID=2909285 RepID=A0AAE9ZR69_9BACT|nr:hypothetical protein [Opitutaceae bacterium LMO-M01]WED63720.1 hypothetical protein PXH66_15395 [Opitutaceae bacterium LMO-M01]